MTLTEFLLARIAEDERAAQAAANSEAAYLSADHPAYEVEHAWVRHVRVVGDRAWSGSSFAEGAPAPRRVLAECEAKRRIVALYAPGFKFDDLRLMKEMSAPYADHPDYQPEWKP